MSVDDPVVSVIVVSYNTREMTMECLRALQTDLGRLPADIWVVDNASTDGSVDAIRTAFADVQVIANTHNRGFGAANNQAMEQAQGAYFLLLNSDAFPLPGAVRTLLACLEANPQVAAVGPRLLNKDGSLQRSCYRFPSPMRAWLENLWIAAALPNHPVIGDYAQWKHDSERDVDFVIGACLLVRRTTYERIGGFDEVFFMYSEETDWQRRMQAAGWLVRFTPQAQVMHLGGASGVTDKPRINNHFFESLDYYEKKHHGYLGLISLRMAMITGCLLRTMLWGGVALTSPRRRAHAKAKSRFSCWLFVRQATCWKLKKVNMCG